MRDRGRDAILTLHRARPVGYVWRVDFPTVDGRERYTAGRAADQYEATDAAIRAARAEGFNLLVR